MKHKLIIVGVGGTGGNLAPMLTRFLPDQWEIILIDGDIVTESNLKRQPYQRFDVGSSKAEALANKLTTATGRDVIAIDKYLSNTKQLNVLTKDTEEMIIIGCVDNHPARMVIEEFFRASKARQKLYIDSANELFSGEIVASTTNKNLRSDRYPEIKKDKSDNPLDASCETSISLGNTQQYATNMQAATIILQLVDDWFVDRAFWEDYNQQNYRRENLEIYIQKDKKNYSKEPNKTTKKRIQGWEKELEDVKVNIYELKKESPHIFSKKETNPEGSEIIYFDLQRKGMKNV